MTQKTVPMPRHTPPRNETLAEALHTLNPSVFADPKHTDAAAASLLGFFQTLMEIKREQQANAANQTGEDSSCV
jgi:hypothetical protein